MAQFDQPSWESYPTGDGILRGQPKITDSAILKAHLTLSDLPLLLGINNTIAEADDD